jgi:hypothetical protein
MTLRYSKTNSKTRLLLVLWEMEAHKKAVKRGELTKRVAKKREKASDYQEIFDELEQAGAIAFPQRYAISLNADVGVSMLKQGLQDAGFEFDGNVVAAKTANALLHWIREMDGTATKPTPKPMEAISSYDEFVKVVLDTYDRLNRDYNFDDLVPIYRLRREIGHQVARSQFNEWMLEMQANNLFQLQGGGLPDSDPSKIEDSIHTELSGLRCYAKKLVS